MKPASTLRLACALIAALWLIPAPALLNRTSTDASTLILGRYDLDYFAFLLVYLGAGMAMLACTALAKEPHARALSRIAVWLQGRAWLVIIGLYAALEGWYALRRLLIGTRFFVGPVRRLLLTDLLLVGGVLTLGLLLAGREPAERKRVIFQLVAILLSVALTFTLASWTLTQVFNYGNYRTIHHDWAGIVRFDRQLGYLGKPNVSDFRPVTGPPEARPVYFTDAQGFRNAADPHGAPLAVIGDSFAYGMWLPYEEMWSTRLGEELGLRVANYSLPAYSLYHYNVLLDRFVRGGGHQVVIYATYFNDFNDGELDSDPFLRYQHQGILFYMSPLHFTITKLFNESPGYQVWSGMASRDWRTSTSSGQRESARLDNGVVLVRDAAMSLWDPDDEVMRARLEQAASLADEIGVRLVVVTIPSKASAYYDDFVAAFPDAQSAVNREAGAYGRVCDYVRAGGALCYDLTPDFRARAGAENTPLYFSTDGHWNAEGSRLAASLIADFLRENGVLGP